MNQYNDNGLKESYWEEYYINGELYYKGNYINGKQHGYFERYYDNGQLKEKIYYI